MTSLTLPEVVALVRRCCVHCENGVADVVNYAPVYDDAGDLFADGYSEAIECQSCGEQISRIENDDVWRKDDE